MRPNHSSPPGCRKQRKEQHQALARPPLPSSLRIHTCPTDLLGLQTLSSQTRRLETPGSGIPIRKMEAPQSCLPPFRGSGGPLMWAGQGWLPAYSHLAEQGIEQARVPQPLVPGTVSGLLSALSYMPISSRSSSPEPREYHTAFLRNLPKEEQRLGSRPVMW